MSNKLSKEKKQVLYMASRSHTGLSIQEWARLFTLDSTDASREVVKKENPIGSANYRGCNLAEALAAQLLKLLHDDGYDLNSFTFDDDGILSQAPKIKES
jgi:hypothetical protein